MTIEERAEDFLIQHAEQATKVCVRHVSRFATQEVKAERERIFREIEKRINLNPDERDAVGVIEDFINEERQ